MNVLRMIKLFGWEKKISERISQRREEELKFVWKVKVLEMLIYTATYVLLISPVATSLSCLKQLDSDPDDACHLCGRRNHLQDRTDMCELRFVLVYGLKLTPPIAAKIFSSMILFDNMRSELGQTNYMISAMIKGKVSLGRFNAFFKETEFLDSYENAESFTAEDLNPEVTSSDMIVLRNASFTWSPAGDGTQTPSAQFTLTVPGELEFKKGKINMIVGPT